MFTEMFPGAEKKIRLVLDRKERPKFTLAQQNWIIAEWKMLPGGVSLHFQVAPSELGVNNVKALI